MSGPSSFHPAGAPAAARNSAGAGGKLLAIVGWLALLCGVVGFALAAFLREEYQAESERRYALAGEQRNVARAAAALAQNLAGGSVPTASPSSRAATTLTAATAATASPSFAAAPSDSGVSALRTRALEIIARTPPEPGPGLPSEGSLQAQWTRLAAGIDTVQGQWPRIVVFRLELEALREAGEALRESADRVAADLAGRDAETLGETEILTLAARRFTEVVGQASPAEPGRLDRARELLDILLRVQGAFAAKIARTPPSTALQGGPTPTAHLRLADFDARSDAASKQLDAARGLARTLGAAAAGIGHLGEASARVLDRLPDFEAHTRQEPNMLGASLDAWLLRSAALALAGLLALFWWRQRLLRSAVADLDQAWGEAAESDWRARGLVLDLLRTVCSLDRRSAGCAPPDSDDLEGAVREAKASLPRLVARRSQLAAALLSARKTLANRLSAARDSVLAHLGPDPGELDTAALLEVEATFRKCTLFAMSALAREIRIAASGAAARGEGEGSGEEAAIRTSTHAANEEETLPGIVARGFDVLERNLKRVLAGEEEERTALIFLLDDLRVVQGKKMFSSALDFDPDLARRPEIGRPKTEPPEAGPGEAAARGELVLRSDAARMIPSFRKGLAGWAQGGGGGASAAMLVRGSVSVLARAAQEERSPARTFWHVAAAFCTGLCERAIPDGPATRRIMGEVARAFEETAAREEAPQPPDRLLRELLIRIALAESDHEELAQVRAAFGLDRYPLAVPQWPPGEKDPAEQEGENNLPMDLIQQLEGIRTALDRINGPPESPSR